MGKKYEIKMDLQIKGRKGCPKGYFISKHVLLGCMTKYFFGKNVGILYEHFPRKFNAVQNGGVNE